MDRGCLFETHVAAGGTIGSYHSWASPMDYGDAAGEYAASRAGSVVFDASMFGRIEVTGKDRLDLLHRLSTNDIARAQVGASLPTLFLTEKGRIIDRVVLHVRRDSLLLETSPGKEEVLTRWIEKYIINEDVRLKSVTSFTTMFYVIGMDTTSTIQVTFGAVPLPGRWVFSSDHLLSISHEAGTGWRGGYLTVITGAESSPGVWKKLTGMGNGTRAIGSTAFETYRISRGIPMSGGELTEAFTPYDAGLISDISFTKGCYIGQEVVARLDTYQKVRRGLLPIRSHRDLSGMRGNRLFRNGRDIGSLTSLAPLRVDGEAFGLGVVALAEADPGTTVTVGESGPEATVTAFPPDAVQ